jgi:predicted Zn-dependent protease
MVRALLKSYEGTPQAAVFFFDDALAEKKYNNEIAAHYGLVASLLRAQNFKRAQTELATLEKLAPPHPMIDAMAGQVLMQSGQLTQAISRYQAALTRYPEKKQLIYDYPEALLKHDEAAKAAAFLSQQLIRYPSDGQLHQIAARIYAALGRPMLEHQHQAEYYAWLGNLQGAITQFELATKARDADFFQSSVVESRLRQLRNELEEQKKAGAKARPGFAGLGMRACAPATPCPSPE